MASTDSDRNLDKIVGDSKRTPSRPFPRSAHPGAPARPHEFVDGSGGSGM